MSTITTRSGKGSPLTNNEVDNNFTNLNTDKAELSGATFTGEIVANAGIALGDNDKVTFGAGDDLQIYHDGSTSYIDDSGTGNLVIKSEDFYVYGSATLEPKIRAITNAEVGLYHNGLEKLATTATGIDVTGTATMDGLTVGGSGVQANLLSTNASENYLYMKNTEGSVYIGQDAGALQFWSGGNTGGVGAEVALKIDGNNDISFYEDTGTTPKLVWSAANEDLNFADNVKATFGAGDDLQIYHSGSHSIIADVGTGDLLLRGNNARLQNSDGSSTFIHGFNAGAVDINYAGNTKLTTTATGIDVTGTVTADGLTVGNGTQQSRFYIDADEVSQLIDGSVRYDIWTGGNKTMRLDANGDISFYEDTGTTPKFFWDASAESLGIGTSSPSSALHAKGGSIATPADSSAFLANATARLVVNHGNEYGAYVGYLNSTNDAIGIQSARSSAQAGPLSLNPYGGNVGIGTSSPAVKFHTTSGVARVNTAKTETAFFATDDNDDYRFGLAISHKGGATDADRYASLDSASYRISTDTFSAGGSLVLQELGGNVGIGTSSPTDALVVEGNVASPHRIKVSNANASGKAALNFTQGTTVKSWLEFDNASGIFDVWQYTNNDLRFGTNNTERMRIDSSGNWMLGTNNSNVYTSSTENGLYVTSTGQIRNSVGAVAAYLNRTGNDGTIIELRKDGTAVGSIGSVVGQYLRIGSGDVGVMFQDGSDAIEPRTTADANRDAAISLGAAINRFKDLYLSGGVYLGGTGAANKLDDYETGTWTPTYSSSAGSFGTTSYNLQAGRYVKVGNMVMVTCELRINTFTVGTASGSVNVSGLPFTAQTESNTGLASVPINTQQNWSTAPTMGFVKGAGSIVTLTRMDDAGTDYQFTLVTDMLTAGTSINRVRFSAVYYAV